LLEGRVRQIAETADEVDVSAGTLLTKEGRAEGFVFIIDGAAESAARPQINGWLRRLLGEIALVSGARGRQRDERRPTRALVLTAQAFRSHAPVPR